MITYGQRILPDRFKSDFVFEDPAERTEPTRTISSSIFPVRLIIEDRDRAIFQANAGIIDLKALGAMDLKLDKRGTDRSSTV